VRNEVGQIYIIPIMVTELLCQTIFTLNILWKITPLLKEISGQLKDYERNHIYSLIFIVLYFKIDILGEYKK